MSCARPWNELIRQDFSPCCGLVAQSCPILCSPKDCSLPGSSVHGIFQARILESGLLFPSPGDLPHPGIEQHLLRFLQWQADFLPLVLPVRNSQLNTVHGILQARILEWVAVPFSRGSYQPRDRTPVSRIAGVFFTN